MSFLIRYLHVTSASLLFGGAVLLFLLCYTNRRRRPESRQVLLELMSLYEWAFWAAAGLLVMTGVGNLGSYGANLPEPDTSWGDKFIVKLLLVVAILLLSAFRTMSVAIVRLSEGAATVRNGMNTLGALYAMTAVLAMGAIGLAVMLSHYPGL